MNISMARRALRARLERSKSREPRKVTCEKRAIFPLPKPATIVDSLPAPTVRSALCISLAQAVELQRNTLPILHMVRVRLTPPQGARESKSVCDDVV